MIVFLGLLIGALGLLVFYWYLEYRYWKDLGFPYLQAEFPSGNLKDMILFRRYQGYVTQEIYNSLAPHPYGGIFSIRRPMLFVRDPEIIRRIMVKDFCHFRDRIRFKGGGNQVLTRHLFNLSGDKWKALRNKLLPTFSSGKLKTMFGLFEGCAAELDCKLEACADRSEMIDMKEFMMRFTADLIGTCAFGLELKSIQDPDNEFTQLARNLFPSKITSFSAFKLALNSLFPWLDRVYRFTVVPETITNYIKKVVSETIEYREKNNLTRHDFVDLLMELKRKCSAGSAAATTSTVKESFEITMDDLAAQSFVFFAAGFDTSSSVMTFCLYELALHPEIQDRLRAEIDEVISRYSGLTYESIQKMEYLDQVISETIRKYPTLPIIHRTCTKHYRMPDSGLILREGEVIMISVYALHHDPKYFPEPEKFDPDRFSPERKSSLVPFTYLPFGEGPRICIGMRFGLLQTKMGLCTLLKKYKFHKSPNLKIPLEFKSTPFFTSVKDPIILQIKHRDS